MEPIGRVKEVLVSRSGERVCGLVLAQGGLFSQRRVLDFSAVKAIGSTYIWAEEQYLDDESDTRCGGTLYDLPVLDGSGEELGRMDDLHFDPRTGRIVALQLSHGLVDDLLGGKGIMAVSGPVIAGDAAIFLDAPEDLAGGVHG